MTYPVAIAFCAVVLAVCFCFWAWLKDNQAQRDAVLHATVEQLASQIDSVKNQVRAMDTHYGLALKRCESALEPVSDIADRLGHLEVRVVGELRA